VTTNSQRELYLARKTFNTSSGKTQLIRVWKTYVGKSPYMPNGLPFFSITTDRSKKHEEISSGYSEEWADDSVYRELVKINFFGIEPQTRITIESSNEWLLEKLTQDIGKHMPKRFKNDDPEFSLFHNDYLPANLDSSGFREDIKFVFSGKTYSVAPIYYSASAEYWTADYGNVYSWALCRLNPEDQDPALDIVSLDIDKENLKTSMSLQVRDSIWRREYISRSTLKSELGIRAEYRLISSNNEKTAVHLQDLLSWLHTDVFEDSSRDSIEFSARKDALGSQIAGVLRSAFETAGPKTQTGVAYEDQALQVQIAKGPNFRLLTFSEYGLIGYLELTSKEIKTIEEMLVSIEISSKKSPRWAWLGSRFENTWIVTNLDNGLNAEYSRLDDVLSNHRIKGPRVIIRVNNRFDSKFAEILKRYFSIHLVFEEVGMIEIQDISGKKIQGWNARALGRNSLKYMQT